MTLEFRSPSGSKNGICLLPSQLECLASSWQHNPIIWNGYLTRALHIWVLRLVRASLIGEADV